MPQAAKMDQDRNVPDGFGGRVHAHARSEWAKGAERVSLEARIHASYVEIWRQGKCLARHERCFGRQQKVLDLDHYLEALERKPGALAGATALEQWRAQGRWPGSYDRYWDVLQQRQGKQAGTRHDRDPAAGTAARSCPAEEGRR